MNVRAAGKATATNARTDEVRTSCSYNADGVFGRHKPAYCPTTPSHTGRRIPLSLTHRPRHALRSRDSLAKQNHLRFTDWSHLAPSWSYAMPSQ